MAVKETKTNYSIHEYSEWNENAIEELCKYKYCNAKSKRRAKYFKRKANQKQFAQIKPKLNQMSSKTVNSDKFSVLYNLLCVYVCIQLWHASFDIT